MDNILEGLNEKQKEAVTYGAGPLLILAGAGSGKTRVLTHRAAWLISKGEAPGSLLLVTFTNKAADEMKERVGRLLLGNRHQTRSYMPTMGTFHSFCVQILRREADKLGYKKSFTIYDEGDKLQAIKHCLKKLQLDEKQFPPKALGAVISGAKNELLDPFSFQDKMASFFDEISAKVYLEYQALLQKNNALDFDDLLMVTCKIFQKYPEVLAKYQSIYKWILVDEYQDTNQAQYMLTKMLAQKHRNLTVVGDDYQAIYSWRGADFRNILNFEHDYPDAKVIKLEQNYRSTGNILEAAGHIISKNTNRTQKKLWTENEEGHPLVSYEAFDERDEARFVVREIIDHLNHDKSFKNSDFVVLYRTHAQSRVFEETLMREGVPYRIIGGVRFYERQEIKDVLAYLRLISNPFDSVSLMRVINVPTRGIGKAGIQKVENFAHNNKLSFFEALDKLEEIELSPASKNAFIAFRELLGKLQQKGEQLKVLELLDFVLAKTGYESFIKDGTIEGEARHENIMELRSVAEEYDHLLPAEGLSAFLEKVALVQDADNLDKGANSVNLMTLHNAKGLEFPYVFIVGLEEGLFPHGNSMDDPQDLEEERRLCYVGITRAKQKVYLSYANHRLYFGSIQTNLPSRFLDDIPEELLNTNDNNYQIAISENNNDSQYSFKIGDKIRHPHFGEGTVAEVEGDEIIVSFKNGSIKKIALSIARIEKIDDADLPF